MNAVASEPRLGQFERLLVVNGDGHIGHYQGFDFPDFFSPGDTLVVNDSATIPSSISGLHEESGREIEFRLARSVGKLFSNVWQGVLFEGGGENWRKDTQTRTNTPLIQKCDYVTFADGLIGKVVSVHPEHRRLVTLKFNTPASELLSILYSQGRPIQYSHLNTDLAVWDNQPIFASRSVSVEAASASFPMNWQRIFSLKERGVQVCNVTHTAGISDSGDVRLDSILPLKEKYYIPERTATIVNTTKHSRGRVIALGTSVVRALESSFRQGQVIAGNGTTDLKLSADYRRQVVDGLFSGLHEPGSSHLELLAAFVSPQLIAAAYNQAKTRGYRWHEYGDSCLIMVD